MEKIIVKQLGVLHDIELELKNFSVFYGQNTTGKSTLAKVIYFFKSFRLELLRFISSALWTKNADLSISAFNRVMRNKFLRLFGPTFGQKFIEISYMFNERFQITVGLKGKYVDFNFHEVFKEEVFDYIVQKLKNFFKELSNLKTIELVDIREEKKKFIKIITNELNVLFNDNRQIMYFPSTRNILAAFNRFDMQELENNNYLLFELHNYINRNKKRFGKSLADLELRQKQFDDREPDSEKLSIARKIIKDLLKSEFVFDSKGEKLFYNETNYVRLNFGSAAQQSVIWLVLLVYLWILDKKPVFLVVEEPEMNLFSEQQKNILNLLALLNKVADNQIVITTHSPLTVYHIGNLLYADNISKENDEVENIIDRNFWLDNNQFNGFEFTKNTISELFENNLYMGYEFVQATLEHLESDYKKLFQMS